MSAVNPTLFPNMETYGVECQIQAALSPIRDAIHNMQKRVEELECDVNKNDRNLQAEINERDDRVHRLSCDVDSLSAITIPAVMEDSVRLYRQERERSVEEISALRERIVPSGTGTSPKPMREVGGASATPAPLTASLVTFLRSHAMTQHYQSNRDRLNEAADVIERAVATPVVDVRRLLRDYYGESHDIRGIHVYDMTRALEAQGVQTTENHQ